MKIYFTDSRSEAHALNDDLSTKFNLENKKIKNYSQVFKHQEGYAMQVHLEGQFDASNHIDMSKVIDLVIEEND